MLAPTAQPTVTSGVAQPVHLYLGRNVVIDYLSRSSFEYLLQNPAIKEVVLSNLPFYKPGLKITPSILEGYARRLEQLSTFKPPIEIELIASHFPSGVPLGFLCLSGIDFANSKAEFSALFFRGQGSRSLMEACHWALDTIFTELRIEKLIFYVLRSNNRIHQLMHKLQFHEEAVLTKEIELENGSREDLMRYTLFKDEWLCSPMKSVIQKLLQDRH